MNSNYVRSLFNGYANRFDTELCDTLKYSGHIRCADAAKLALKSTIIQNGKRDENEKFAKVIDIGCGTGLTGE